MEEANRPGESIQTPVASNMFRLNASEFESSTPGISTSEPKGPLIEFEEYGEEKSNVKEQIKFQPLKKQGPLGIRNLTIKIDDSFGYTQVNKLNATSYNKPTLTLEIPENSEIQGDSTSSLSHSEVSNEINGEGLIQPLTNELSESNPVTSSRPSNSRTQSQRSSLRQSDRAYQNQIQKLTARVITVEEKLFYYEDYNKKLLRENNAHTIALEESQREIKKLTVQLRKKDEVVEQHRQKVQILMNRLAEIQREKQHAVQGGTTNRVLQTRLDKQEAKLRQKEQQIKELQKKNEKVVGINKVLQKELRESEKKLVELEKQMHRTTCSNFYENVTRLKESSLKLRDSSTNKENNQMNASTHTRKSLEVKKNPGGITKAQRTNSSNVNLLAKKLGSHMK